MEDLIKSFLEILLQMLSVLGADKLLKVKKSLRFKILEMHLFKLFKKAFKKRADLFGIAQMSTKGKIKKDKVISLFTSHKRLNEVKEIEKLIIDMGKEEFQAGAASRIIQEYSIGDHGLSVMKEIVEETLAHFIKIFHDSMKPDELKELLNIKQRQFIEEIKGGKISPEPDKSSKKDEKSIPKGKQIKILFITASPDDENMLLYEQDQDALLSAFQKIDRDQVFLDMPDPVKSTLEEIKDRLKNGKHDILHITAHGGKNDKGEGFLCFEDHRGKLEKVTGSQLVGVLKRLNPTPLIVILSSCHSARRESNLMPTAGALYDAGIVAVICMEKAISHAAAIDFNVMFFSALFWKLAIKLAFEAGKYAIKKGEERRLKANSNWNYLEEYQIPRLLTRRKILNVRFFSDYRIEAPGRPQSHHFQGAKYLERGFIGRRRVLQDIFKTIDNKQGAVVLKGPGGIGKSALTTRIAANLVRDGYDFIIIRGDTSEAKILEAISNKAAEHVVQRAKEVFADNIEPIQKLSWFVENFLGPRKVMIIFDNFEENQDEASSDFRVSKESLKQFIWTFRDYLKNKESFLFFSTRYMLPGFESPDITIDIREFTPVEFRKMLWNGQALKLLDRESIETLQHEIGGNPRALELLDRIAYTEFHEREFKWEQLKDLIPELRQRIIKKKGENDDFAPLFLDKLIGYLSPAQRLIMDVLSIYRNPVPIEALKVPGAEMTRTDRIRLVDLSLLECIEMEKGQLYYVHRLTAQYILDALETSIKQKYHLQAGQYFEGIRNEKGEKYFQNDYEARWHYLQAREWDRAAEITFSLEDYLTLHGFHQLSMELLRELENKELSDKNRSIVCHQMGNLFLGFGNYEVALTQYQKSLEIREKIGDIRGVAISMGQMGDLYLKQNQFETALKLFLQSFIIFTKIGSAYAKQAKGLISKCRGKLPEERFQAILKEFEIDPKVFDPDN